MSNTKPIIISSIIFLIGGPIVGCILIICILAISDVSALAIIFFLPIYGFAIVVGGLPALITGICFGILREKLEDRFSVTAITLIACFLSQFIYIFCVAGGFLIAALMAVLGVVSALIIIFFMDYFCVR